MELLRNYNVGYSNIAKRLTSSQKEISGIYDWGSRIVFSVNFVNSFRPLQQCSIHKGG